MKKRTIIISSSAAMLFCILAATAAYKLARTPDKPQSEENPPREESVQIYRPVITAEPAEEESETSVVYYYLQSEGNLLNLYEIDGASKKSVKSVPINPEMFPLEDRQLLKEGIKANTLEEGIEIIENFVS